MSVNICMLGKIDYKEALILQNKLVQARQAGRISDTLLLLEHPPVLTKGTRTDATNIYRTEEELQKEGIGVYEVNRGGDVTYHGPGQIIGYPIFNLRDYEPGIRVFIDTMQEAIIQFLKKSYSIEAYSQKGKMTGVWIGDKKIAAFGLAVKSGITMHGFALNINTDLAPFQWINPCGLSRGVTSVQEQLGNPVDMLKAFKGVTRHLVLKFSWLSQNTDLACLNQSIEGDF
jgi:lipoyl(octanoyl) transferase